MAEENPLRQKQSGWPPILAAGQGFTKFGQTELDRIFESKRVDRISSFP